VINPNELKISFLEVGQGDSIILEWNQDGIHSVGIVDCKKHNSVNPVLQHLKALNLKEIEFIVLSHPHSDHYSGFSEVLTYISENKILIKNFYLTTIGKEFLAGASRRGIERSNLANLMKQIFNLCGSEIIQGRYFIQGNEKIDLNEFFTLKFISPTHKEYDKFLKSSFIPESDNKSNNNEANFLSSVALIQTDKSDILLTADTEIETLKRIKKENHIDKKRKFLLGQVPHHGSIENHFNEFWDGLANDIEIPSIISCGNGNKHPHQNVVKYFNKKGKKSYLTRNTKSLKKPKGIIGIVAKKDSQIKKVKSLTSENRVFSIQNEVVSIIN
jgi:beta-lactamase superfamily II metal-dependent hydrolase